MNNPRITIITVCFNCASSIEKTIQSVLQQSYIDKEYVVIDGESNDGTLAIIQRHAQQYPINYISEPDTGIYDAMNKGIMIATGEWLIFMNAGDTFVNEDVVASMAEHFFDNCQVVYGNVVKCYPDKRIRVKGLNRQKLDACDFVLHTIDHQTSFIKKKLFEKYGLYDTKYRLASDWKFFFQAVGVGKEPIKYIPLDVCFFMMDGASTNNKNMYKEEADKILKEQFREYYPMMIELANYRKSSIIRCLYKTRLYLKKKGVGERIKRFFSLIFFRY